MTQSSRFPPELLEQSSAERLRYFKNVTVPHRNLQQALNQLLLNLQEPADISIFFIVGPTGVGKTTLRLRLEKMLLEEALPRLLHDPGPIPVVGFEVAAPDSGKFSYRDYYLRALDAIGEVMLNHKTRYGLYYAQQPMQKQGSSAALRRSLENVLRYRQVQTLMLDEAQHLLLTSGAHQMLQQMNWVKSIANLTQTTHALFGTYELLNCCHLSGQLSRRSDDIHLSRYQAEQQTDIAEFLKVVQTFQRHMPLAQEPSLEQRYDYLLESSVGCVGILKSWLIRAFRLALLDSSKTLTLQHLQHSQYSPARLRQLREEADAGEQRLEQDYSSTFLPQPLLQAERHSTTHNRRVGQRKPIRDPLNSMAHFH